MRDYFARLRYRCVGLSDHGVGAYRKKIIVVSRRGNDQIKRDDFARLRYRCVGLSDHGVGPYRKKSLRPASRASGFSFFGSGQASLPGPQNKKPPAIAGGSFSCSPYEIRTRDSSVKGRRLNPLTNGPVEFWVGKDSEWGFFCKKNNVTIGWRSFKNGLHAAGFFENPSVSGMEPPRDGISLNVHERQVHANLYLCRLFSSDKPLYHEYS
jgi:hypothetical protein